MGREGFQMGDPLGIGANLLTIISAFKDPKELVAKLRRKGAGSGSTGLNCCARHSCVDSLNRSIYSHYNTGDAQ